MRCVMCWACARSWCSALGRLPSRSPRREQTAANGDETGKAEDVGRGQGQGGDTCRSDGDKGRLTAEGPVPLYAPRCDAHRQPGIPGDFARRMRTSPHASRIC
jgi:hypothetical protein